MTDDTFKVERGFKTIIYHEGDRLLKFDREPGGTNPLALVWVPSPKLWRESVPEWARARRREILSRMRAVTGDDEWQVFYAAVDAVREDDLDWDPPEAPFEIT